MWTLVIKQCDPKSQQRTIWKLIWWQNGGNAFTKGPFVVLVCWTWSTKRSGICSESPSKTSLMSGICGCWSHIQKKSSERLFLSKGVIFSWKSPWFTSAYSLHSKQFSCQIVVRSLVMCDTLKGYVCNLQPGDQHVLNQRGILYFHTFTLFNSAALCWHIYIYMYLYNHLYSYRYSTNCICMYLRI